MNALEIRGLSKSYGKGKQALSDVSLNIAEGSFFALLGPNGAGKSTLINILADIVHHESGSIHLLGRDLFKERGWCKRRLGVVPQEVAFDPFFSPREILRFSSGMFGVAPDEDWIEELLIRLELKAHAEKNTRQLSGGMRRRLLVAQALVHRPRVVVLDEPTAGVDVELRKRLWVFMQELNAAGTTVLLTTHYLEEAEELCDQVAIIDRGKLLMHRPMQALLADAAARLLRLKYNQPLTLNAEQLGALSRWRPRIDACSIDLAIPSNQTASSFHTVYTAAIETLGVPVDVAIVQEDLEDIFLRLTGDAHAGSL
ncbi:MAG: ABC transporter ATP-binding protein [Mariprofundaceae bacterium]|nr:ABC transporter ATP-binding protein [Mariprofundaceae bacterium]